MKENKGITMIALVVTIIVMLILAGVSVGMALGNGKDGIIPQTKKQVKSQEQTATNISTQTDGVLKNYIEDWGF